MNRVMMSEEEHLLAVLVVHDDELASTWVRVGVRVGVRVRVSS